MIRVIVRALGTIMLFSQAYAQNTTTDTSATCVAYWQKGDVRKFQITKTSVSITDGKETKRRQGIYESTMTVKDSTEKGYTIEWQCRPVKTNNILDVTDIMSNLLYQFKIVYTASPEGSFESLVNYEELKAAIRKSTKAALDTMTGAPSELKKGFQELFKALENRTAIESLILREIAIYHSPYGLEYSSKTPQVLEGELPNIFGGDPIPAVFTLSLTNLDKNNDLAFITIDQKIDREKGAALISEVLRKLGAPSSLDRAAMLQNLDIHDIYQYDLALADGWIKKAVMKREIRLMDIFKTDTYEIKIK